MALTECPCGEPLYDYQLACPQCGARNQDYASFGWGRRIAVVLGGVGGYQLAAMAWPFFTRREPVTDLFLLVAVFVAVDVFAGFRVYDTLRLAALRRNLPKQGV
jgi:hypothetical protein